MRLLWVLIGLFFVTACASTSEWTEERETPPQTTAEVGDGDTITGDVIEEYRLGSGDRLRIIIFGEPDLSGEFMVNGAGFVSMPLIGEIAASDKTITELQRDIETALRDGYLNEPQVSAEVLNFRPFYILGEVNTPGTFPYTDGLTVLNAVATAGGFTYRANERVVYIRRAGETKEHQYKLTSTTPVRPGDTIRIGERIF